MIIIPSDLTRIVDYAANKHVEAWYELYADEKITEKQLDGLLDQLDHNLSRFNWIIQLAKEQLMTADLGKIDLKNGTFFLLLRRDFEWDWSCEIDPRTYWPFGLKYRLEEHLENN